MSIVLERKSHVFRFPTFLLDKLKELAQNDHRSLNNYVEGLLLDAVYHEPNEVTLAALKDARQGNTEGPIDTTSVDAMLKSIAITPIH